MTRLRILLVCCAALASTVGVSTAIAGGSTKKPPPVIDLKGGSYTVSTSILGSVVTGRVQFSIKGQKAATRAVVRTRAFKVYGCLTNGVYDPLCSGPDTTLYKLGFHRR